MRTKLVNTIAGGVSALAARMMTGGGDIDGAITATGSSSQANSYGLRATMNKVTAGGANTGVRLPSGVNALEAGDEIWVFNVSGAAVLVYPETGGQINDGAANASVSLADNAAALIKCWGPGVYTLTV